MRNHPGRVIAPNRCLQLIERMLQRRDFAPIFEPTPPEYIDEMLPAPSENGAEPFDVLVRLQQAAQCRWSKMQGGDLAFIPSGGLYSGAIAALLAGGLHAFTGAAFESPALVALEESVLRWLASVLLLRSETEGVLLSGGSLANQTAIVCTRDHARFEPDRSIAYLSESAQHRHRLHRRPERAGRSHRCIW